MEMDGWHLHIILHQRNSKRDGRQFFRTDSPMVRILNHFKNSVMSMFGYIDNDVEKVHEMVKNILSPALGRSPLRFRHYFYLLHMFEYHAIEPNEMTTGMGLKIMENV